ncbi:hypothetical protein B566_EDAN008081, partial [Ephemera danica]
FESSSPPWRVAARAYVCRRNVGVFAVDSGKNATAAARIMVDLSASGPDGPLEHGFSNSVFVFPAIVTVGLVDEQCIGMDETEDFVPPPSRMDENDNFVMPDKDELLEMIKGMEMSEEQREDLRKAILGEDTSKEQNVDEGININAERLLVYFAIIVMLYVFVFFGYKLYRSLADKERKREDKRKVKGQKKKK